MSELLEMYRKVFKIWNDAEPTEEDVRRIEIITEGLDPESDETKMLLVADCYGRGCQLKVEETVKVAESAISEVAVKAFGAGAKAAGKKAWYSASAIGAVALLVAVLCSGWFAFEMGRDAGIAIGTRQALEREAEAGVPPMRSFTEPAPVMPKGERMKLPDGKKIQEH